MADTGGAMRVVVVDDDPFTVSLVTGGLRAQGFEAHPANTIDEAWRLVEDNDPHALITDLDLGDGASGLTLLTRVREQYPWVGIVVLTAHRSPRLAVEDPGDIPDDAVYLVKSSLRQADELGEAVRLSILGKKSVPVGDHGDDVPTITAAQAEVLRMLANGASTRALAEYRGTTVRAVETMLTRLYAALGLSSDDRSNPRVEAVRMWQQGRVRVR